MVICHKCVNNMNIYYMIDEEDYEVKCFICSNVALWELE